MNPVPSAEPSIAICTVPPSNAITRSSRDGRTLCIVGLGLIGVVLKLAIALNTFGTTDVLMFYEFANALTQHDLAWLYQHSIYFNHPPLTAYYLRLIFFLDHHAGFRENGLTFPMLLRLPGIVADFVTLLVVLRASKIEPQIHLPTWGLALFALSPVSLMVTGFHGNTDSVMVMFLVLASWMCRKDRPWLCALFFALSCQVKVILLLFFPILFFFWEARRASLAFVLVFASTSLALSMEALLKFPVLLFRISCPTEDIGGHGVSPIGYASRNGDNLMLRTPSICHFTALVVASVLKAVIVVAVLVIAWRRRHLCSAAVMESIGYGWIIFFILSPGVSVQYLVWLAPFVLMISPALYGWLVASSSLFAFFFYNSIAGEWPWYSANANASREMSLLSAPWSLLPWATLIAGIILIRKRTAKANPTFSLFSLGSIVPHEELTRG